MEGQGPDKRRRGPASAQLLKAVVGQEASHLFFSLQTALEAIHRHSGIQILEFSADGVERLQAFTILLFQAPSARSDFSTRCVDWSHRCPSFGPKWV